LVKTQIVFDFTFLLGLGCAFLLGTGLSSARAAFDAPAEAATAVTNPRRVNPFPVGMTGASL
jgi:hypothetical protein